MKIGIIGAMDLEIATLKEKMTDMSSKTVASMEFFDGSLNNVPVVIVKCGIGKVNAGICVQILHDLFSVTHVINTGVAGSLRAEINIGDIVVSTDAAQHDIDVTALGYQVGQIPQIPVFTFEADKSLADTAVTVCREVNTDIQVFRGRVVSGDQFISSKEKKKFLIQTFDGCCTEMEGAAIAQAAYLNGLPFVIIRAISDKADDSAEVDYPMFEHGAALHSAKLVEAMLERL
ncbi:MAG: 5'-methylthioadenosine/adenosylhomocysteine nucleosidase [Lachnospiraceae bacterium]|nr:5'-methylthioadenosine/adenosylhomocysteine nucleosidase [Lachnospiraceae bacterium]MBD5481869.1 5'-methylthioadenosine/adenosylhomocysteine nucleosidase [Lachnospiraceae bacterium]